MTFQNTESDLLVLCKPYLSEVANLLTCSLKNRHKSIHDLIPPNTTLPPGIINRINALTYLQKIDLRLDIDELINRVEK